MGINMSAENLQPEYRNAIQVLSEKLPSLTTTLPPTEIPRQVFQQGNTLKFEDIVIPRRIPGHTAWRWNQSKSKQKVQMADGSHVEMIKLIPRRRAIRERHQTVPSYKLWLFHYFTTGTRFSVTWCEKGTELESRSSPVASPSAVASSQPSSPACLSAEPSPVPFSPVENHLNGSQSPQASPLPSPSPSGVCAELDHNKTSPEDEYELMSGGIVGDSLDSSPSHEDDFEVAMTSSLSSYHPDLDFATLLNSDKKNSISLSTPMDINSDTWLYELLAHY